MTEKIPFQNRIIVFLLSIILIVSLFVSFFALPVELIFFNSQNFSEKLQNEEYTDVLPNILAETLVFQASLSSQSNQIDLITNREVISSILSEKIPAEMVQTTFDKVLVQTFSYLNFKIPTSDMKINVTDIKTALASASPEIAAEFLATLPNCSEEELTGINSSSYLTLADLPKCKPSDKNLVQFEQIWGNGFEDMFNQIPATVSLTTVIPLNQILTDQNFYYYSLVRWGFRLLPILSILLLILMAVLLRKQREVMWKWIGRLLIFVSAITLIGLVILLIGFDQFVAMLLNPYLKNLVTGFGYVLLSIVQDVGYEMLIWVIITAFIVMGFGLLLLFIGRQSKRRIVSASDDSQIEELESSIQEDEPETAKTIIPETLDEIEEKEKNLESKEAGE